jgi:hypothetical protein
MGGPTSPTLPAISARRTSALLSCHPRLISPGSLLPHIKTCDRRRRDAMKRDFDHGDLICLQRRTNRLPDCGTRADRQRCGAPREQFRRLSEQQASQSCHRVRDRQRCPACAPILTAEAHASRANLGWRGVSQRTKFRSSELQSSSGRRAKPTSFRSQYWCKHAATNQENFAACGCTRHAVGKQLRSANQSCPPSRRMTGRRRA